MLFLSGLFLPISKLPIFLQPLSYCLPLTYGADMLNGAIMHTGLLNIWLDFIILLGFAGLLFYISQRNIRQKWIL
jgi:ABC-2 type transport system permease protein